MYKQEYIGGFALGYGASASVIPYNEYHMKNDYEIMYIRRGNRKAFVKEHTYYMRSGNLLFIDKNTLHKTQYVSDEYERFVINFTDDYVLTSVKENMDILFEQRIYAPQKTSSIDKLFFAIFNEWDKMRKGDKLASDNVKCYVNLLLTHFICNHSKYAYNDAKLDNPAIERLVNYMNNNFMYPITLDEAAKYLKLSPAYLSKLFLKHTGFGFLEYLKILRIENGKHLLATTNISIKQIASQSGFNDSNYFATVFKNETGVSPLQYRKNTIL